MKRREKSYTKLVISLFIAFIMVSSILGYYYGTSEDIESYKYNEYNFKKIDNRWVTYIGKTPYYLTYDPKSLEDIEINRNLNLAEFNSAKKIYLTFNPDEIPGEVISEMQIYFMPLLSSKVFFIMACTEDIPRCEDAVLKTCSDATSEEKIIQIEIVNDTIVNYNNNCLSIQGENEDLIRAVDRIIWDMLGVME